MTCCLFLSCNLHNYRLHIGSPILHPCTLVHAYTVYTLCTDTCRLYDYMYIHVRGHVHVHVSLGGCITLFIHILTVYSIPLHARCQGKQCNQVSLCFATQCHSKFNICILLSQADATLAYMYVQDLHCTRGFTKFGRALIRSIAFGIPFDICK